MTVDQGIEWIAAVTWPIAFLLGVNLLCALIRHALARIEIWVGIWKRVEYEKARMAHRAATEVASITNVKTNTELMLTTCERAILAIIAANGGLISEPADWPREVVRHIREMYKEIEKPTARDHRIGSHMNEIFDDIDDNDGEDNL